MTTFFIVGTRGIRGVADGMAIETDQYVEVVLVGIIPPVTGLQYGILQTIDCWQLKSYLPIPQFNFMSDGTRGGVVVKALCYKPEGRGFDSRWCHWNFSVT